MGRGARTLAVCCLTVTAAGGAAHAQGTGRGSAHAVWVTYAGDFPVAPRVSFTVDQQLRLGALPPVRGGALVRPGLAVRLPGGVRLSGGYAISVDDPIERASPIRMEHRVWEAVQLVRPAGPTTLSQRLRLEERYTSAPLAAGEARDWSYQNRLRYQLRNTIPLPGARHPYLILSDELFMGFGGAAGSAALDQNRAIAGLGARMVGTTRLEASYLMQSTRTAAGRLDGRTHILVLAAAQ